MAEGNSINRSFRPASTSTGRRPDNSQGLREFICSSATRGNLVITRSRLANTTTFAEDEEMEPGDRTEDTGAGTVPVTPHVPRDEWREIMAARGEQDTGGDQATASEGRVAGGAGRPPEGEDAGGGARDQGGAAAVGQDDAPRAAAGHVAEALGQTIAELGQLAGDPEAIALANEALQEELSEIRRQNELKKTRKDLAALAGDEISISDTDNSDEGPRDQRGPLGRPHLRRSAPELGVGGNGTWTCDMTLAESQYINPGNDTEDIISYGNVRRGADGDPGGANTFTWRSGAGAPAATPAAGHGDESPERRTGSYELAPGVGDEMRRILANSTRRFNMSRGGGGGGSGGGGESPPPSVGDSEDPDDSESILCHIGKVILKMTVMNSEEVRLLNNREVTLSMFNEKNWLNLFSPDFWSKADARAEEQRAHYSQYGWGDEQAEDREHCLWVPQNLLWLMMNLGEEESRMQDFVKLIVDNRSKFQSIKQSLNMDPAATTKNVLMEVVKRWNNVAQVIWEKYECILEVEHKNQDLADHILYIEDTIDFYDNMKNLAPNTFVKKMILDEQSKLAPLVEKILEKFQDGTSGKIFKSLNGHRGDNVIRQFVVNEKQVLRDELEIFGLSIEPIEDDPIKKVIEIRRKWIWKKSLWLLTSNGQDNATRAFEELLGPVYLKVSAWCKRLERRAQGSASRGTGRRGLRRREPREEGFSRDRRMSTGSGYSADAEAGNSFLAARPEADTTDNRRNDPPPEQQELSGGRQGSGFGTDSRRSDHPPDPNPRTNHGPGLGTDRRRTDHPPEGRETDSRVNEGHVSGGGNWTGGGSAYERELERENQRREKEEEKERRAELKKQQNLERKEKAIKSQVEKAFKKADDLKEEYDDSDQRENVTIPRIEVVYRELNSADLNYKNLLQSGESELESLIYEETEIDISDGISNKIEDVLKMKAEIEQKKKDKETKMAEERKNALADFGKMEFPQLKDQHCALEWMDEVGDMMERGNIDPTNMKTVNNLKKQMMVQDVAKVRGMTSVDEIIKYINDEYCGLNYSVENTLKPILTFWRIPVSTKMMRTSIAVVEKKLLVLEKFGYTDQITMSIVVKLEQVCLTVDLYKDYKLELETKEKELTGNKDDDVITIYDEGYRKRVTETDGNVTRITTKANLEDKLTPAKRLHFFMKFVGRKMAAMTTRAKEASQWGVQPFENKKKFVNLTKDNYKKSYSDELIHFCAQVDEDDYEARSILEGQPGDAAEESIHFFSRTTSDKPESQKKNIPLGSKFEGAKVMKNEKGEPLKPCVGGCGQLHPFGSVSKCDEYNAKPVEGPNGRIEHLKSRSLCLKCTAKKYAGQPHTCKNPTCNYCAAHSPSSKKSHHWSICPGREKWLKKRDLAKKADETVAVGQSDETVAMTQEDDGNDEEDPVNIEQMMNCHLEEEEHQSPFKEEIPEYENSDFDIREGFEKLREVVKEKMALYHRREKTKPVDEKGKATEKLLDDIKNGNKVAENVINLIEDIEKKSSPTINKEKLVELCKELSPGTDFTRLTREDFNQIANKLEDMNTVEINQKHENKNLFENIKKVAMKCYIEGNNKVLAVVQLRAPLAEKIEDEKGLEKLIEEGAVEMEEFDGRRCLLFSALLDGGATMSGIVNDLEPFLEAKTISEGEQKVNGISGPMVHTTKNKSLALVKDNNETVRVEVSTFEKLANSQILSPRKRIIIEENFKMTKEDVAKFHWPGEKRNRILCLLGRNCSSLLGVKVDPADLGLGRSIYSPDLEIVRVDIAARKRFAVSGAVGVNVDLIDESDKNCVYPTFKIPREFEHLDELPDNMKYDWERVDNIFALSDEKMMNPVDLYHFSSESNSEYNKEMFRIWSDKQQIDKGKPVNTELINMLELENNDYGNNEDIRREIVNTIIEDEKEENDMFQNEALTSETCSVCSFLEKAERDETIMMSISEYLDLDQVLKQSTPLCRIHTEVVKKCKDCKEQGREGKAEEELLMEKYVNGLVTEVDPKDPEKLIIVQTHSYLADHPEMGQLEHSMVEESLRSTKNMYRKAVKAGKSCLKEVDKHFGKMKRNGAVRPVNKKELEEMIAEQRPCNFICRGLVKKETSLSTSHRVIADTSRLAPGVAKTLGQMMCCPKKQLNKLILSNLIFHLNENHLESDIQAAYYQIKCSEETSFLLLSIWYHDVMTHGDKLPLILASLASEFGWSNSGINLSEGIRKFPAKELDGFLQFLVNQLSYVDNFGITGINGEKLEANLMMKKLKEVFGKYSINLDKIMGAWNVHEESRINGKTSHNCYGLVWWLKTDTVQNLVKLSKYKSTKGSESGPRLEAQPLDPLTLTRRQVSRLASQLYDATGRGLMIVINSARLILSLVCEVTDVEDSDKPISDFSKEVATQAAAYFNGISGYKDIKPLTRYVLPAGYELSHIVISHDGGEYAFGATVHFVSKKKMNNKVDDEEYKSLILAAKSSIAKSKAYENEVKSYLKALELCLVITEAYKEVFTNGIRFYVIGDNKPSSWILSNNVQKSTVARNTKQAVRAIEEKILELLPGTEFIYSWLDSKLHPSDRISKYVADPIPEQEGEFWRFGPDLFKSETLLQQFVFSRSNQNGRIFTELPKYVIKEDIDMPTATAIRSLNRERTLSGGDEARTELVSLIYDSQRDYESSKKSETTGRLICVLTRAQRRELEMTPNNGWIESKNDPADDVDDEHDPESDFDDDTVEVEIDEGNTGRKTPVIYDEEEFNSDDENTDTGDDKKPTRKLRKTEAFFKQRHDSLPKSVKNRADNLVHKLKTITGVKFDSGNPPIFTSRSKLIDEGNLDMTEDLYTDIIDRREDLGVSVRVATLVLRFHIKMKNRMAKNKDKEITASSRELVTESTRMLVKADQKLFPPSLRGWDTKTENEVIFIRRNIGESQNLFRVTDPFLVSAKGHFFPKLLRWAHVDKNAIENMNIHHPVKSTRWRLEHGSFCGICPQVKKVVTIYCRHCPQCLRSERKFYSVELGEAYTKIDPDIKPFDVTSFDPLGGVEVRPWPGSKSKIKVYPIIFRCISTGIVELGLAESLDQTGIVSALRRMIYNIGVTPSVLTHDAQPSFTEKNLSPLCEEGRLFGQTKFKKQISHAQRRNYCESAVNLCKSIMRKALRKGKNEATNPLSKMTTLELLLFLRVVTHTANSVPYGPEGQFSPGHLRYGLHHLIVSGCDPDRSVKGGKELSRLEDVLCKYTDMAHQERKMHLLEREGNFRKKLHRDGNQNQKLNLEPQEGDIVLIKDETITEDGRLGRITKMKSPNTAVIQTSRGPIERLAASLHPLVFMRQKKKDDN